jgi:hypothetical protein
MRDDFEMTETFGQMYLGMFVLVLMVPCGLLMGFTPEQAKRLFAVTTLLYVLPSLIFLIIERRLWEKAGYLLRQFHFVFTVFTILYCLLFLVVIFVLWLTGLMVAKT